MGTAAASKAFRFVDQLGTVQIQELLAPPAITHIDRSFWDSGHCFWHFEDAGQLKDSTRSGCTSPAVRRFHDWDTTERTPNEKESQKAPIISTPHRP